MKAIALIYTEEQNEPSKPETRLFEIETDADAIKAAAEIYDWNEELGLNDEPEKEVRATREAGEYGDIRVSGFDGDERDDTHVFFTFLK